MVPAANGAGGWFNLRLAIKVSIDVRPYFYAIYGLFLWCRPVLNRSVVIMLQVTSKN